MVLRSLFVSSAFLLLVTATASQAKADPITVTFIAFPAPDDPVNTAPSTGSFTFDSRWIPEGGGFSHEDVTEISFMWGQTQWTTANAVSVFLRFSLGGELISWLIGGKPGGANRFHGIASLGDIRRHSSAKQLAFLSTLLFGIPLHDCWL